MRKRMRTCLFVVALAAVVAAPGAAAADAPAPEPATAAASKPASQGIAVLGVKGARDEAFALARPVYTSSLRPRGLDELHARILAGDPPPPTASKELRDLAELRAAITGDDAPSRQLLGNIAQQLHLQGLLVVRRAEAVESDAGAPEDAGAPAPSAQATLFMADTGDFDAARYEPDANGWDATVRSLARRYPPPAAPSTAQVQGPAPKLSPTEGKDSKPFYASPWFWGAIGAAVLVGGFFWFSSRDTSDQPIHLQMYLPR